MKLMHLQPAFAEAASLTPVTRSGSSGTALRTECFGHERRRVSPARVHPNLPSQEVMGSPNSRGRPWNAVKRLRNPLATPAVTSTVAPCWPDTAAGTSLAKRIFDRIVAGAVLLTSSPALAVIAVAILLEDGSDVLFRQNRTGYRGTEIRVAKLRSMRHNQIDPLTMGQVDGSNPLVTRTGRVIRRLKIDELPQLLSVLHGDLSLVGPRPALIQHVTDYDDYQRRRLEVRPGLTGWAQVNGNTSLSWEDRIRLDVWYVDNWSFRLDMKILVRTVLAVVVGERPNTRAMEEAVRHEAVTRRRG